MAQTTKEKLQVELEAMDAVMAEYKAAKAAADKEFAYQERTIPKSNRGPQEKRMYLETAKMRRDDAVKAAAATRDKALVAVKGRLADLVTQRRAELAPQRHAARLAIAPAGTPKAEVLPVLLQNIRSADDLIGLHSDAVAAGDEETAWLLEQTGTQALAKARGFPENWQRDASSVVAVGPWEAHVDAARKQRAAPTRDALDAEEAQVGQLEQVAGIHYMTSDERREFAATYGVAEEFIPED